MKKAKLTIMIVGRSGQLGGELREELTGMGAVLSVGRWRDSLSSVIEELQGHIPGESPLSMSSAGAKPAAGT